MTCAATGHGATTANAASDVASREQAPGHGELYHFAEDPDEMANLWDASEASSRKADLLEKLCLRQLSLRDMRLCPTARA